MIRKFLILLCLCCVVLCAIVGYLSKQVDQEADKRLETPTTFTCADFISGTHDQTAHILVTDFGLGKHMAHVDRDSDGQWDELCVPLFPKNLRLDKYGYKAILVCVNGVKSKEELKALTQSGELDTSFWPERQDLAPVFHSQLAQKYTNLDFSKSVVLHCGYQSVNPVLGETTLQLSKMVGGGAAGLGVLCFLSLLVFRSKPRGFDEILESQSNLAGLP